MNPAMFSPFQAPSSRYVSVMRSVSSRCPALVRLHLAASAAPITTLRIRLMRRRLFNVPSSPGSDRSSEIVV